MLLYAMAAVIAALWFLDTFFTVQVLRKKGDKKEANGLMRGLYRRGIPAFLAIKFAGLAFVISVLFLLSINYLITAESVMFIFIYIYAKVDWHNYRIWKNRNSKTESRKKTTASPKTPSP